MRTIYILVPLVLFSCGEPPKEICRWDCIEEKMQVVTRCTSDSGGKALIGGLLFGNTGAIIGGASGKTNCRTSEEKICTYGNKCTPNPKWDEWSKKQ